MSDTQPFDFIGFDGLLTDDERLVRSTVRRFVAERYAPQAAACFRDGRFPLELVPELAELGLFGARIDGYGCAGMGPVEYGLTMQELERGDSGLRSFVSVQGSLAMEAIHAHGSERHKQRWLPEMAAGRAIGCFGLTEPNFGSNPGGMQTRARRDGGRFILNGEKTWITNGSIAAVAVVWAKLDDSDEIGGFLVEKGAPGFTASDLHGKLSMRASITSSLSFVDCAIPAENALPGAVGLKAALRCLTQARLGIGWGCIGAAQDCYETARRYCLDRKQFGGRPIAAHQLVQAELAWMATEISKAQLLARRGSRPPARAACTSPRCRCSNATTPGWPWRSPAAPGIYWAPTASPRSTRSSATWPTWRP